MSTMHVAQRASGNHPPGPSSRRCIPTVTPLKTYTAVHTSAPSTPLSALFYADIRQHTLAHTNHNGPARRTLRRRGDTTRENTRANALELPTQRFAPKRGGLSPRTPLTLAPDTHNVFRGPSPKKTRREAGHSQHAPQPAPATAETISAQVTQPIPIQQQRPRKTWSMPGHPVTAAAPQNETQAPEPQRT